MSGRSAYNRDFGYDDINRLTSANSGTGLWDNGSYQYDAMGNMTTLHIGSRSLAFAYVGSTPKIQSVNLLEHIGNADPRMEPGISVGYSYDGRGVRIITSLSTPGLPPWGGTKTRRSLDSPELHLLSQSGWSGEEGELGEPAGRTSNLVTRTRSPRTGLTPAAIRPTMAVPIGGSSTGTDYI